MNSQQPDTDPNKQMPMIAAGIAAGIAILAAAWLSTKESPAKFAAKKLAGETAVTAIAPAPTPK